MLILDKSDPALPKHYGSAEAARMLGCSTKWLHAYLRDKPWYRLVGSKKLFDNFDNELRA